MSQTARYPSRGKNHPPPREYRNDRDSKNRNGPPPRDAYRAPSYSSRYEHNPGERWPRDGLPPPSANYRGPPGGDNYQLPQSDFTFQVDKPAGVQDADTYRPQGNRKYRNDRREPHSPDRDGRPSKRSRGPHDRSFGSANGARPYRNDKHSRNFGNRPWRPFVPAERELLKTDHNNSTEVAFFNTAGGVTYRPLNELSDSDEAEMDISGDEAAGSTEEPMSKRARSTIEQSASDNTPKWSNPDPYTALPPETATQGKKKDVVRMIRKSRVQEKEVRSSLPSGSADFISFDSDSDASEELEDDQEQRPAARPISSVAAALPVSELNLQLPPKPPKPGKTPVLLPDPTPSALGSRKRTHDDEIKMPHTRLKKVTKAPPGGGVTKEWVPDPELESTPWMEVDHSGSANMSVW